MPQIYKVFIKGKQQIFKENQEIFDYVAKNINYKDFIQKIESNKKEKTYIIDDLSFFWKKFKKQFNYIQAAGGIVLNNELDSFLAIKRLGVLDLPKGKIEKNEKKKKAAKREIEEETGVTNLSLIKKLSPTYHTYTCKYTKDNILKKCNWYLYTTTFKGKLVPQKEEDISSCFWYPLIKVNKFKKNTYPSIKLLLQEEID